MIASLVNKYVVGGRVDNLAIYHFEEPLIRMYSILFIDLTK